jgi:hypothetical protein
MFIGPARGLASMRVLLTLPMRRYLCSDLLQLIVRYYRQPAAYDLLFLTVEILFES